MIKCVGDDLRCGVVHPEPVNEVCGDFAKYKCTIHKVVVLAGGTEKHSKEEALLEISSETVNIVLASLPMSTSCLSNTA
jgi:hypothetical protein